MRHYKHDYDAFISHAVEDKIPIANELCAKLERAGLRIWYSGKELGIGDSIEKTIENGLHRSRYGIVILSPTYLAKNWTIREFYSLLAKEIEEHKVILPVLYNITLDELKNKDLLMADRFAVNADRGIDYVVDCLVREIRKPKLKSARTAWFSRIWLVLAASLLANVGLLVKNILPTNADEMIAIRPDEQHREPVMHANLFHEMQALFTQLSSCTCDHSGTADGSPFVKTRAAGHEPGALRVVGRSGNRGADRDIAMRKPGKMTMAVVFQIEPLSESPSSDAGAGQADHMGNEFDEMMESITPRKESPFVVVSNRSVEGNQVSQPCMRAGFTGE